MIIKKSKYQIEMLSNNIVRIEIFAYANISEKDLIDIQNIYREQLKIKSALFLIVIGKGVYNDLSLMKKLADPDRHKIRRAEALVLDSIQHKVESQYFKKHFDVGHPIKIFSKEKAALDWLKIMNKASS